MKEKHDIKISIMVSLPLKLRIDAAAAAADRSVSKYLQLALEKIVPPAEPQMQIDIEELIAQADAKPRQAARIRKIVQKATTTKRREK